MRLDIELKSTSVGIKTASWNEMNVELHNVDTTELMNHLDESDVINHFGADELLDEIGTKEVIEHFGIEELLDNIGKEAAVEYFNITEQE